MKETRTPWTEIVIFSIVAVVLYHIGLFLVFFLVPMQILYVRRGETGFRYGMLVFLGGVLVAKTFMLVLSSGVRIEPLLVSLDFLLPLAFLAALYVLNLDHIGRRQFESPVLLALEPEKRQIEPTVRSFSVASRLVVATTVGAIISLPLVIYLLQSQTLAGILKSQAQLAESILKQSGGMGAATEAQGISPDQIVAFAIAVFSRIYVFGFFLMIYLNWYIGTVMGRRTRYGAVRVASFGDGLRAERFKVPNYLIWPLIVGWGGVIVSLYAATGPLQYVAWNLALVVAFLYGVQGIGIVQYLFRVHEVSRGIRYVVLLVAVALLFVPIANFVVLVGFPLFGVSETWIHYRRLERSEE